MTNWTIIKVPDEFPLWKLNKPYELPIYVYEQEIADSVQELIRLGQATGTRDQMIEKLRPAIEASCRPTAQGGGVMVKPSDYGVGELCSLCGELYGPRAIYCEDGDVICEECEATGADSVQPKEGE